jgi:sporulation protein YlmC with PRC-barrel domain
MSYLKNDVFGIYKSHQGPGPQLMGAKTLIGEEIINNQSEDLGAIKEIMLDMRTGKVAYAVMSFGGFMGVGDKLFAVPWAALTLDTVNKRFVLDAEIPDLVNAPGFQKDAWPDMNDAAWVNELHSYYGIKAYQNPPL